MISKFHYLTQDLPNVSHQDLVLAACKSGVKWVQLRVKNKSFDEYLQIAIEVKKICDTYGATLIINDQVEICQKINAHGVHLGKQDMPLAEARKILGQNKIIGATANTLSDVLLHQQNHASYIGLGPYAFTNTKKKLSPVLGIDGYTSICSATDILIPVIAIGGIQMADIQPLLQTGVYGVAVSSAINLAQNKPAVIAGFLKQIL